MAHSQYERVSVFREDTMTEIDTPKLTPRSSYSTGLEKRTVAEPIYNYKPLILRSVPLLSLLALTFALIGLLEYTIVQIPHGSLNLKRRDDVLQIAAANAVNIMHRRSDGSIPASLSVSTNSSSSTVAVTAYTTASAYVDDSSTLVFSSIDQSAFVQPDPTTTTTTPLNINALAKTSAYVQEYSTSSQVVLQNTAESAFVPDTQSNTVIRYQLLRSSLAPTAASAATSAYVPGSASGATSAYVPRSSTTRPRPTPDNENSDEGTPDGSNTDGQNSGLDNQNASIQENGNSSKGVLVKMSSAQQIFLGSYLAVCVAVIYRLLWLVFYNAFNLIDPFRQLMDREGALAETAFFAFYQSQSNLLGPIPALIKRRWASTLVGSAYLIVNLLPALASESVFVDTKWDCPNPKLDNTNNPCSPRLTANVTVVRIMQGLLGFAALVILVTTSLLLFNKTGLPTKPNSIAAVASLMKHPRLVADLSDIPVSASTEHMQRLMEGKRYRLGHYTCANGLAGYGIQPWNGYDTDGYVSPFGISRHQYTPIDGSSPFSVGESSRLRRFQIKDFVLAFCLLGAFGVVLAYYLDGNADGFNDFFNSNTFGPRFILTLAGTVIASIWKSVEHDAVVMAPYIRLFKRPSSPTSTILMTSTSTPISSTIRTLRNRYFLASSITMLTLAAEGLNVVISGIPYANGQRWIQFIVSTYMSIAILGVMILVTAVVIVTRFWEPKIPRKPTTLGAVMSYICSSRLLDDFEGMECLDQRTRDQRIRLMRKKYEFTETVRRDGKLAWTIDDAFDQPRY